MADYIIIKNDALKHDLSVLKLHKLAYYAQAWHLAITGAALFDGKFQAWVHGPISRSLYDRFSAAHIIYDQVDLGDIAPGFAISELSEPHQRHLDDILAAYAHFSCPELTEMVRAEDPWLAARGNARPAERCETDISEGLMRRFYE